MAKRKDKHTRGRWRAQGRYVVRGPKTDPILIGEALPRGMMVEQDANARLMAAAPDMLRMLRRILKGTNESVLAVSYETRRDVERLVGKASSS